MPVFENIKSSGDRLLSLITVTKPYKNYNKQHELSDIVYIIGKYMSSVNELTSRVLDDDPKIKMYLKKVWEWSYEFLLSLFELPPKIFTETYDDMKNSFIIMIPMNYPNGARNNLIIKTQYLMDRQYLIDSILDFISFHVQNEIIEYTENFDNVLTILLTYQEALDEIYKSFVLNHQRHKRIMQYNKKSHLMFS